MNEGYGPAFQVLKRLYFRKDVFLYIFYVDLYIMDE